MATVTVNYEPANMPLTFTAGDDFQLPIRFGTKSGGTFTPYVLATWSPKMEIRRKNGTIVDTLTIANGKFFLQESDTELNLWIKAEVTESLSLANCEKLYYDLQVTANGRKRTYFKGEITIVKQITTG